MQNAVVIKTFPKGGCLVKVEGKKIAFLGANLEVGKNIVVQKVTEGPKGSNVSEWTTIEAAEKAAKDAANALISKANAAYVEEMKLQTSPIFSFSGWLNDLKVEEKVEWRLPLPVSYDGQPWFVWKVEGIISHFTNFLKDGCIVVYDFQSREATEEEKTDFLPIMEDWKEVCKQNSLPSYEAEKSGRAWSYHKASNKEVWLKDWFGPEIHWWSANKSRWSN